jgi:rod shape-determining protein MreB
MAAAVGIRLPVMDPVGSMIVDIGGGTTDIAVISLGGVVRSKNLRIAGDKLNNDIISYVRNEFKILIGEKTAEDVKIAIGAMLPQDVTLEASIKGRDLISGLPREVIMTETDVRNAFGSSIESIVQGVVEVIETTPPEIVSDVMARGIYIVGGGALIHGLAEIICDATKIQTYVAADPLTAVVRGTGIILDDLELYREILIADENDLPPKR